MLVGKKYKFNIDDIKEITVKAYYVFIEEFKVNSTSGTDESDCGEISSEIESFVETNWKDCDPLDGIYGTTASNVIKETVKTVKEESQCAGIKFFNCIVNGKDQNLIETCTSLSYWCCCEAVKKVSPIIAEASTNLMY